MKKKRFFYFKYDMFFNFFWVMIKEYKKINVYKFLENFNGKNVGFF